MRVHKNGCSPIHRREDVTNNETDACKIYRCLSEDIDKPQCEFVTGAGATACLSKDRAMLVLLNRISEKIRVGD